ncbi:LOW QUALITY PROTEIN: hypothetical protein OSB04_016362 [Centaurea solstitialis]|uniref:Uncharacterized protein n=1 Tax=Centaurea solstitialis TaxID=347529 RepID=A0AA38W9R0_9ASTR|nr:LOW QUALITY PROTEIN: hypothetical protein OSB04_016362 [Centaurea solstitialis]
MDIGEKVPKVMRILAYVRAVVVYTYNHGRILNMISEEKNRDLHRSSLARFATQFHIIQSINENRHLQKWRKSDYVHTCKTRILRLFFVRFWHLLLMLFGWLTPKKCRASSQVASSAVLPVHWISHCSVRTPCLVIERVARHLSGRGEMVVHFHARRKRGLDGVVSDSAFEERDMENWVNTGRVR